MKKLFTLLSFVLLGTVAYAQDTYAFSDKDGNVYEDGVTIERNEAEDDGFGGIMVPSGLYAKNVNGGDYQISIVADITKLDNGSVMLCFPDLCKYYATTGKQTETGKIALSVGEAKDMMTEWLPTAYGECSVTYTMNIKDGILDKGQRTITVNYKYADPSGIDEVKGAKTTAGTYYNLSGQRVENPTKGLYIVNGKKVILK